MAAKKNNLKITNEIVLVLTDFFLPLRKFLPTIETLAKNKNRVIVVSYFGKESLLGHAGHMAEAMGRKFIDLPSGSKLPEYDIPHLYFVREVGRLSEMRPGDIVVVENLNLLGSDDVKKLSSTARVFVNDDFSAGEDLVNVLKQELPLVPGIEYSGVEKKLQKFLIRKKRPTVLILGGVNLEGKEKLLDKLMARADFILVGGALANLFFKLRGWEIGKSAIDRTVNEQSVKKLLRDYSAKIKTPPDVVVKSVGGSISCKKPEKIGPSEMILDIGPQATLEYSKFIKQARTLIWCGALGQVETPSFRHATQALLRLAASRVSRADTMMAVSGESVLHLLDTEGFYDDLDLVVRETRALLRALTK